MKNFSEVPIGPNDFKIGILMHELIKIANGKRRVIPDFGYNFIDARDLSRTAIQTSSLPSRQKSNNSRKSFPNFLNSLSNLRFNRIPINRI